MQRFTADRTEPMKKAGPDGCLVLSEKVVRTYKSGYRIVERVYHDKGMGARWRSIKSRNRYAINPEGVYIGSTKTAHSLVVKRGIAPEAAKPKDEHCSIGKGKDGKWYGWSHRAIYGFKPGHVVSEGDIACGKMGVGFQVKTDEDARKMAVAFADDVG